MREPKQTIARPIRWHNLRTDEAEREIARRLLLGAPFVIPHAFARMAEREELGVLNSVDMMEILRRGSISRSPRQEDRGWIVIVEKRMPGSRLAGVVTLVVNPGDDLEVWTVQWMDWE